MKTITEVCDDTGLPLQIACRSVYNNLQSEAKYEADISRELLSPRVLGGNPNVHASYVRTALDLLESAGLIKKKNAKYSIK